MLEISRQDVSSLEIQSESHLPFDLNKFLDAIMIKNEKNEQVPLKPIGPQVAMINAFLNSNYRFLVGCLSRRTGKTLISNALGLITILIPDTDDNESVDIKVISKGKEMLTYRLEVFIYPKDLTKKSRAEFVKESIENIDSQFEVMEIGLEGETKIPVLLRKVRQ